MLTHEEIYELNQDLTPEVMKEIDVILEQNKSKPGSLIPVLEDCQRVVGYLPMELLEYISDYLNIPGSTVFGVVTFYSFFTMVPRGRHQVKVCIGTACYVKGAQAILDRICDHYKVRVGGITEDKRFSVDAVRCIGACGLAPAVVINENTYGDLKPDKIIQIMEENHP